MCLFVLGCSEGDQGKAQKEADRGQREGAGQQNNPRPAVRLLRHRNHAGPGTADQEADDVEGDRRRGEAFLSARSAPVERPAAEGEPSSRLQALVPFWVTGRTFPTLLPVDVHEVSDAAGTGRAQEEEERWRSWQSGWIP